MFFLLAQHFCHEMDLEQRSRRDSAGNLLGIESRVFWVLSQIRKITKHTFCGNGFAQILTKSETAHSSAGGRRADIPRFSAAGGSRAKAGLHGRIAAVPRTRARCYLDVSE